MERFKFKFMALALSISCMAGYVDTLGFLKLGGYFVSFMSGNSTRLSVAWVGADWRHASIIGSIISLFVLGALLGTLGRRFCPETKKMAGVLLGVTLSLTLAALFHMSGHSGVAIGCMTLAMGSINTIFEREGEVAVGLTYMTGTLVKVGQRAANAMMGGAAWAWVPYLLLWLSLILGGTLGVISYHYFGLYSLWLSVFWAASLSFILLYAAGSQRI